MSFVIAELPMLEAAVTDLSRVGSAVGTANAGAAAATTEIAAAGAR